MRARLLLIPFIFSVPAYGQDISSDAAANPPGQVKYAPVRDLSQLPMDGGWTYGEVLDKAAAETSGPICWPGNTGWGFIT